MASIPAKRSDETSPTGMRGAIQAFDWAATPLGPIRTWPAHLKLALDICLASAVPSVLYWGPDYRMLFNDAWAKLVGEPAARALGQPVVGPFEAIWGIVGPQFEQVRLTGEGLAFSAQMLPARRDGVIEETYWSYSLTPVFDEAGSVAGILNQGEEVTRAVLAERRLSFQVALADRLRGLTDPGQVKDAAAAMLGDYLGAARVGFVEVDEAQDTTLVSSEWRRSDAIEALAGHAGKLSTLPAAAVAYLRSGEVLALGDVHDPSLGGNPQDAEVGTRLGVRAVISVPLVREGRLRALLYVHEPEPRRWKRSEAAMARDVAERSWAAVERAEAEQKLRENEDHYRHTVELNPQVTWTAGPDGQLDRVSRRWFEWTGTSGLGDSWAEGLHPDDRQRTFEVWGHSVATGEPYDIEHRVKMLDGRYRWARSRAFPRYGDDGRICLWYGSTEDMNEQKLGEERQRLLINELNHRVKNTLATVQAIAFQTLKGDVPLAEARARFEARLMALSRAHNMLTEQNWEGAPLSRVVAEATGHLAEPNRFVISGDDIWLSPRAALALSLALHELSTNAAKYGALSSEGGRVSIRWSADGDRLTLRWKESGGPAVAEPAGRGFGSRLIERGLAADLGGTARLAFECDGLGCTIEASLSAVQVRETRLG